jgi:tellurite resistance protein TerC
METSIGFPIETVIVFLVLSVGAIAIDMYVHGDDKPIPLKSAALWSIFWIAISMGFAGYLHWHHGAEVASLFVTGYALEKVLSVDNLFVMMAIFSWFSVPDGYRHRVLYWGIMGAIVFRLIFVAIGTSLLMLGPWVEIVFAAIVAWTAIVMLKSGGDEEGIEDYSQHLAFRSVKKLFPVWPKLYGHKFLMTQKDVDQELALPGNESVQVGRTSKAKFYATPLLLCLAVIELSDVMFAFDSVPAVIAVSREPLIVFSAMMFAILGLRTLYFVLEALKQYLVHLEKAVVALLFFIAGKLALNASNHLFNHGFSIDATTSLVIVLITLSIGILASIIFPEKEDSADAA